MDYNFNLKHQPKRKLQMSSFLQPPGLERCFSTSGLHVSSNMANKLNVDPLINFISGFRSPKNCDRKATSVPFSSAPFPSTTSTMSFTTIPSSPFSSASVSFSCFVGGNKPLQQSENYCENIVLDVLLNEFTPFSNMPGTTVAQNNSPNNMKKESIPKRTYAEVAKEKPRPVKSGSVGFLKASTSSMNPMKISDKNCDNYTVLRKSHSIELGALTPKHQEKGLYGITKVCSEIYISPKINRLKSCSSSSESCGSEVNISRTLSECSAESDDSFIVFQNDDEGAICDFSEEESSDDGDESSEELATITPCSEKESSCADPKCDQKKTVKWKADEELVKVHPLVTWDYASRAARVGPWEQYARDRERFSNRIQAASSVITPVLQPSHRTTIYNQRFTSN